MPKIKSLNIFKVFLVVIITLYMLYYLTSLNEWHFIDNINLIFHEAGHVIFMFFGEYIHIIGGTLMQILVPIVLSYYFYYNKDHFSASLLLFWVGQNFINISIYAGDAVAMELPLLGGDNVGHDWNNLLSSLNLLNYTDQVAASLYFMGIIIMVFAIVFSIRSSVKKGY